MNILSSWLRNGVPDTTVSDAQLAEDLTLRGIAVEGVHALGDGQGSLFEMDITTNRVDAMNHYGIAREVATIYDLPLMPFHLELPQAKPGAGYPVRIEAPQLCGRFTARVLREVRIAPSEGQVAEAFQQLGLKAISNAVDASNWVLQWMGHPTHAFDLDKIEGGIVVRLARQGETLRLLDGSSRVLEADDLVVADERKALALAGVMGGWDSMITQHTKNILVEAAWFDPVSIRRSSRRHGLHTDASHRFERGADFNACAAANTLVSQLILKAGGFAEGGLVDVVVPEVEARTARRAPIALRVSEVQRHLGTTADGVGIGEALVVRYLTALGCSLQPNGAGSYAVTLPSWRLDLEREIDLIEEVARVYGYNRFADSLPGFSGTVRELAHGEQESVIRATLRGLGYSEAISSTFCAEEDAATFAEAAAVPMGNPLSAEAGVLRPALTPGMATMLANNLHRDVQRVRLFEMGTVFAGSTADVSERRGLALGLTGGAQLGSLHKAEDALIYEAKGALEALLGKFGGALSLQTTGLPGWIAEGRGARLLLEGSQVAVFGELSAAEQQRRKLRQAVVLAEVDAQQLLACALRRPLVRELSRFQAVERDFSFVFSDAVQWAEIEAALRGLGVAELQSVAPVEIFRDAKGKAVAAGSYSLLTRVVFQSPGRTLAEEELAASSARIIAALVALGGVQRA